MKSFVNRVTCSMATVVQRQLLLCGTVKCRNNKSKQVSDLLLRSTSICHYNSIAFNHFAYTTTSLWKACLAFRAWSYEICRRFAIPYSGASEMFQNSCCGNAYASLNVYTPVCEMSECFRLASYTLISLLALFEIIVDLLIQNCFVGITRKLQADMDMGFLDLNFRRTWT